MGLPHRTDFKNHHKGNQLTGLDYTLLALSKRSYVLDHTRHIIDAIV